MMRIRTLRGAGREVSGQCRGLASVLERAARQEADPELLREVAEHLRAVAGVVDRLSQRLIEDARRARGTAWRVRRAASDVR